ncbi:dipeptide epimerase [Imperialibacter roseus]|uniref:Dipeptide epimerase n=1 Tax=Imperialibacter roseus TaxID=1324217 RepID=A0ABZ0IVA3_9BACT|nr:dipeptide epimerase [Imperialibacter roseus]WOK08914.1 dipeptide epimerase [Imperialibacter roseus]
MIVTYHPVKMPLRHTFTIAHGSTSVQESFIVALSHNGKSGFGEATANPYYGVTVPKMTEQVESVRSLIESGSWKIPEEFHQALLSTGKLKAFTLCALDLAFNDLYGKLQGKPLYKIWGLDGSKGPISNYTIGIDTVENMVAKMKEVPWPLYKIKLGTKEDIRIIEELRKNTGAVFRVDANCAWGVDETIANSRALKKLNVQFIEQPLKADDLDGMKRVFAESELPVIADESCQVESDVDKCFNHFHGINIKLTKCGGLTPARRMIARARELNMSVMMGCMTESSVGISAIAQVVPLLDYVDMDGALLLAEDPANGVQVTPSGLIFPNENGTGASLK